MHLSINIDHIATLRNARGGKLPDPIEAARIAERAGADGIVCHLREDRRHITDRDVKRLRTSVTTKLDLEMAATDEIVDIALAIKPDLVTLVPERREELTTEGGLDVIANRKHLREVVARFRAKRINVSLFIDPNREQIEAAHEIGADTIEIHTGEYANAGTAATAARHRNKIAGMAAFGKGLGLVVNAGHGLDYDNIGPIVGIRELSEVSIGYAVIVRSMYVGLEAAVREMKQLVRGR
jgi:pyridoxine 5-phosphate synthase